MPWQLRRTWERLTAPASAAAGGPGSPCPQPSSADGPEPPSKSQLPVSSPAKDSSFSPGEGVLVSGVSSVMPN